MGQENQGQFTELPDKETISQMSDEQFSSLQESINTQLSSSSGQSGSSSTTSQQQQSNK